MNIFKNLEFAQNNLSNSKPYNNLANNIIDALNNN